MMNISDMIIDTYMLESALLKTENNFKEGPLKTKKEYLCINFLHSTIDKFQKNGKEAIYALSEGDEQKILLLG